MKKLALALMCLVSLAFFASCNPEGQPTISNYIEEGYVKDGDVVNIADVVNFGFVMASSPVSNSTLASLVVTIDDQGWDTIDLTGKTEYTYTDSFTFEAKELIGEVVISAVVTDAAGQIATSTMTLKLEQDDDQPLLGKSITWTRKGANLINGTEEDLASYGLKWPGNYKEVFVLLELADPDHDVMYLCNGDDFESITTENQKNAYFTNLVDINQDPITEYRNITTNHTDNYNDMLAIVHGEDLYLIHITHAAIETGSYGTQITITGESK